MDFSPSAALLDAVVAAFDHLNDAVVVATQDADPRIVRVNAAFARAVGLTPEAAAGRSLEALQRPRARGDHGRDGHEGEGHEREGHDARAHANGEAVVTVSRADGTDYVVARRRIHHAGPPPLVIEIQRDLSSELRAHATLREREALYRLIAERSHDVISRIDARGVCTYVSPSCRAVLGYEPEELLGRRGFELTHPEELDARQRGFHETVARGELRGGALVTRVRHKDGRYVWLETVSQVVRGEDGALVEVQSSARDVTARIEALEARARSDANFRELLERFPEALVIHREGALVHANEAFVRLVGAASAEEVVGRPLVDFVHPEERELVRGQLAPDGSAVAPRRELRLVRGDGAVVPVEVAAVPMVVDGQLASCAIAADLTARKRLEEQLAIAERMASLGRLASSVGHEINNPLAYVLGSLQLAQSELATAGLPEAIRAPLSEHLATAQEGAERVRTIVKDMKQLTVTADDPRRPIDVRRALDLAAATARHEVLPRARLVRDYDEVAPVFASEGRMVQVFVNLLVNAAQSITSGTSDENEIRLVARMDDRFVLAEVHDTGAGLAPEHAARIFEPFFTTKTKGAGTGLGLSISHGIVTALGGTIRALPALPRGTVFRVTLPACEDEVRPAAARSVPAPSPEPAAPPPNARILVVDDEPALTRVLVTVLRGYEVEIAHSGREALDRLQRPPAFDAVLCDLHMDDGGGIEVFDYVEAHAPALRTRFAFMTGGAFTDQARELLKRAARPCIDKPFQIDRLRAIVAAVTRGEAPPPSPDDDAHA